MAENQPWPAGGGETGKRIRLRGWASTPLGPVERWPQSLRAAVDITLCLAGPAWIVWGPTRLQFYNDGYIPIAADRHPDLLGQPAAQNAIDAYQNLIQLVELHGGAVQAFGEGPGQGSEFVVRLPLAEE